MGWTRAENFNDGAPLVRFDRLVQLPCQELRLAHHQSKDRILEVAAELLLQISNQILQKETRFSKKICPDIKKSRTLSNSVL